MRESNKGDKVDHRNVSDPIKERKDFIDHLKHNAPVDESKIDRSKFEEQPGVKK